MELLLAPVAVGTRPGSENTKLKHFKVFLSSAVWTMFNVG